MPVIILKMGHESGFDEAPEPDAAPTGGTLPELVDAVNGGKLKAEIDDATHGDPDLAV